MKLKQLWEKGKTLLNTGRKRSSAAAVLLAAAAIFWFVNDPAIVGVSATTRQLPVYCVQRDGKMVSLTFDAAWGNEDTQTLIDILGKYNVKATFFLVGQWVDKYPESVKALSDAGEEIGNHSNDHAHFASLSSAEIVSNISACSDKIEAVTGKRPTLFRAPYGEYDDNVIVSARSIEMQTIQWNVDSLDWKGISADEITRRVTKNVVPGSIILFHNAAEHTPEALPGIIEYLIQQGYTIVPVSELLLTGETVIDHTGCQCPVS